MKRAVPASSVNTRSSVVKFGFSRRFSFPKRNASQPRGANGASSNRTAPSAGRLFAGLPKRCSPATVNERFVVARASVGGVTFTRICGGTNSSMRTVREPSRKPSSPGVEARISQHPLGWSSGTVKSARETTPNRSVTCVRRCRHFPSGVKRARETGNGFGALPFPSRRIAWTKIGSLWR